MEYRRGRESTPDNLRLSIMSTLVNLILAMTYLDDMIDTRYRDTNQGTNRPAIIRSLLYTYPRPAPKTNQGPQKGK